MARIRKTVKSRPHRRFSLCVLFILVAIANASKNCAEFSFPSWLHNSKISAAQHSTVNFSFALDTVRCNQDVDKDHLIYVAQETSKKSSGVDYCAVSLSNKDRDCRSYKPQNCQCTKKNEGWEIVFTKTVTRSDNGPWTWQTGDGLSTTIVFDIQGDTKKKDNPSESPAEDNDMREKKKQTVAKASSEDTSPDVDNGNNGGRKEDNYLLHNKEENSLVIHDTEHSDEDNSRVNVHDTEISDKDNSDEAESPAKNDVNVVKDDNDLASSSMTTGVVVGTLSVVSIVVVLVIVFMCRRRKERKARRTPPAELPPPPPSGPDYAVMGRPRPEVPRESYMSVASVVSETYDVIPAACHSFENETYLVPMVTQQSCKENLYTPLA